MFLQDYKDVIQNNQKVDFSLSDYGLSLGLIIVGKENE